MITCTGTQEDGDEEEIDEATSQLSTITSLVLPFFNYVSDTRYIPDLEMLPAPMLGGGGVIWKLSGPKSR